MPGIGDVIADKYRLDRVVGKGGMGVVYGATHLDLSRPVAVKFVVAPVDVSTADTARLLREARAIALLSSEHVARVFDAGVYEREPYVVLELLEGKDLESLVKTNAGPLEIADACEYIIQACHGLGEAHAHGIVHRDVKPSNLFLTQDASGLPRIKVIDFGIAKALRGSNEISHSMTSANALIGSPPFMSPEQLASNDVDLLTDVWSLGVTLFHLLAGHRPFEGPDLMHLFTQIRYESPKVSLRDRSAKVRPELEAVVMRCLAKDPTHRFPSAASLARALLPFSHDRARWVVERLELLSKRPQEMLGGSSSSSSSSSTSSAASPSDRRIGPPTPPTMLSAGVDSSGGPTTESTATLDVPARDATAETAETRVMERPEQQQRVALAATEPVVPMHGVRGFSQPAAKPASSTSRPRSRSSGVWLAVIGAFVGLVLVMAYRNMHSAANTVPAAPEAPPIAPAPAPAPAPSAAPSSTTPTTTSPAIDTSVVKPISSVKTPPRATQHPSRPTARPTTSSRTTGPHDLPTTPD